MAKRLPRSNTDGKRERYGRIEGRKGVALRKRRLERSNWLCEDCRDKGDTTVATEVDHIIPLHKGGTDTDDNTRNLCGPCHEAKTREDMGHRPRPTFGPDGWPT